MSDTDSRTKLRRGFRDSRGEWRTIVPRAEGSTGGEREAMLGRALAMYNIGPGRGFERVALAVIAGMVAGTLTLWLGLNVLPLDERASYTISVVVALCVLTCVALFRGGSPTIERAGLWLAQSRLCLSCGYDLVDVRPASDGCTVCPECGSAYHYPTLAHVNVDEPYMSRVLLQNVGSRPVGASPKRTEGS